MTKKSRNMLMSVMTLVLCLTLVAGGTYALFSDEVTLENHLQAGTLDITLTRTNLVTTSLSAETGFLVDTENSEDVDFSNATKRNLLDISENTRIVPGCEWNAEMQISNNSDVAFCYWIEVKLKSNTSPLAEQMKVILSTPYSADPKEAWVSDGCTVGSEADPVGVLAKTGSQLFTIKVMFVDDKTNGVNFNNNSAKGDSVNFDIVVHAVQVVDAPVAP